MTWNALTFAYGSVLTSTKMVQLLDNIAANANGDSGSPAEYFISADQSITSGGGLTIAHGLGVAPRRYRCYARCVTAEYGSSIGDKLYDGGSGVSVSLYGLAIVANSANILVKFSSAGVAPLAGINFSTGALVNLSNANWVLVVEAWKL
jgi:hypothetical protein